MVLLLARTHFTLLTAPAAPRELCEEAVRRGCDHLALCDTNGLYGLWAFAQETRRLGLRALFGAELVHAGRRVTAIARDRTGHRSLCRLLSARNLDPAFDLARALGHGSDGLWLLCSDLRLLPALAVRVPRERLRVALPPRGQPADADPERDPERAPPDGRKLPDPAPRFERSLLVTAAATLDLPLVAVRDVWFPRPSDHGLHRLFLAVKHNRALRDLGDAKAAGGDDLEGIPVAAPGMHLPERGAEHAGFADFPAAVGEAERLRADCTLAFAERSPPVFPAFAVPPGQTPIGHLRGLCAHGLRRRYGPDAAGPAARLERELTVIEAMGFAPYFLVVDEIAGLARARGIPFLGRGSAADSIVAYCLGLTDADPVRHGLLFERFLNPARSDLPDIDLDFCWRRRDELLAAVYAHFGDDRLAMIATYNTCGPRAAWQEAARVGGVPPTEAGARSQLLPWHARADVDLAALAAELPGFRARGGLSAGREARILQWAQHLLRAPRHLGVHPGGVVIVPDAIADHAPLERSQKGVVVTQFDMHAVEGIGLVKIDLLGNRALTIAQDTVATVRELGAADGPAADPVIAEDDAGAAGLLGRGDTLGCFQVESPAMRTLLRQVQAVTMERVIQAIALVRPGPAAAGMKEAFIRRARGLEPPTAAHPLLAEVFADTFGIMLYQEDVIRAAMAVTGMDGTAGDSLRRELGKGRAGAAAADAFVVAGLRRGLPRPAIEQVWREMARFAGYSFCKAHAVSYGQLAWRCIGLKARWPGPFLAAVLRNEAGYFDQGVYVEDLKRHGVVLRPPCVQEGAPHFAAVDLRTVRVGLAAVRGLSARTLQAILDARRLGGRFRSVADFVDRVRPASDEVENLVLGGALDGLGGTRPALLWQAKVAQQPRAQARRQAARQDGVLLREALAPPDVRFPDLPDHGPQERTRHELRVFGFALGRHPVDVLWQSAAAPAAARGAVPCGALGDLVGRRVRVFGWMVAHRLHRGSDGRTLCFVTLEDGTGIVEGTLSPPVFARCGQELQGRGPFLVQGRIEDRLGGVGLQVQSVSAVQPGDEPPPAPGAQRGSCVR